MKSDFLNDGLSTAVATIRFTGPDIHFRRTSPQCSFDFLFARFGERCDAARNCLYAVNIGSKTISAYTINPSTGALTEMPFRLISADGATCTSGGLQGSIQSVVSPATLAPGESAMVDLRIARPEMRRFRFFVNVLGGIQSGGANGLNAKSTASKRSSGPVMIEVDKGRIIRAVNRTEVARK